MKYNVGGVQRPIRTQLGHQDHLCLGGGQGERESTMWGGGEEEKPEED